MTKAKKKAALSAEERIEILKKKIDKQNKSYSKVVDSDEHKLGSVKLCYRLSSDGNMNLHLVIYSFGKDRGSGKRSYDFIKISLDSSKVVSDTDIGTGNDNAILEAETIRKTRKEEMKAGKDVTKNVTMRSKMLLTDWMEKYSKEKKEMGQSDSFSRNIDKTIKQLVRYAGDKVQVRDVDEDFCKGFLRHLAKSDSRTGKPLSKTSQFHYFKLFRMALGKAVREKVIAENPAARIDPTLRPKLPESTREYLDVEEVKALITTPCANEATKRAYLFSCFCGLRFSDIKALTWDKIITRNGRQYIEIKMVKTGKPLSVGLSDVALEWMPDKGEANDTDNVFVLPSQVYVNKLIRDWAKDAGITKHLSFHTGRHTFATLELTAGADIYTTCKLLGHRNVKTTQIYAKLIDKKKDDAVDMVSSMFNK